MWERIEIGLQLETRDASPDFSTGVIEHSFSGKLPSSKERLNKSHSGKEIECLTLNKNNSDNPSGPDVIDLVLRREVRLSKTSSAEKKQLWGKSYSRILMLERSQFIRLSVYTELK